MIQGRTVLAVIPARGGSKGVPGKNLRQVGGQSLIARAVAAAKQSRYVDRTVFTSEDATLIEEARRHGSDVPFVRPPELARDDTPGVAPIAHAIEMVPGYDYAVVLQPTSPLRTAADVDGAIEMCVSAGANVCFSVTEAEHHPYWIFFRAPDGTLRKAMPDQGPVVPRQEMPAAYAVNGAVYVTRCAWFLDHRAFLIDGALGYRMPRERSIDIDTEWDLKLANWCIDDV